MGTDDLATINFQFSRLLHPWNLTWTWKEVPGKGDSFWKPSFSGSMLNFGGVVSWRSLVGMWAKPETSRYHTNYIQASHSHVLGNIFWMSKGPNKNPQQQKHISQFFVQSESKTCFSRLNSHTRSPFNPLKETQKSLKYLQTSLFGPLVLIAYLTQNCSCLCFPKKTYLDVPGS